MREKELLVQLIKLIDQLDVNELTIKHQIDLEFERYNTFLGMLGRDKVDAKDASNLDPKYYARYLFKSGSFIEKRELLRSLKSKLVLEDKK